MVGRPVEVGPGAAEDDPTSVGMDHIVPQVASSSVPEMNLFQRASFRRSICTNPPPLMESVALGMVGADIKVVGIVVVLDD